MKNADDHTPAKTTPTTTKDAYGLRYEPRKFLDRDRAFSCAARTKGDVVMLGDDGRYWIVCMADAARLERAGIEWA